MQKRIVLILLTTFINVYYSYSQDLKRNQSIIAYVNNFCKYIEWENENDLDYFNIYLISDNNDLIESFEDFAKNKKVKGKKINLVSQSKPDIDYKNAQLIFIDKEKLFYYFSIFESSVNNDILLVSEDYTDQRFVMINLYNSDDERLLFEVNKSNIINQNLTMDPEILLVGGTEIDIAELFRESQITLLGLEKSLQTAKLQIDSINMQIPKLQEKVIEKEQQIEEQNLLVAEKEEKIKSQEAKFEELNYQISAKERLLQVQLKKLESKNDSLAQKTKLLSEQESLYVEQQSLLAEQKSVLDLKYQEIEKMDKEIEDKNKTLGLQNTKIVRQRNFIFLFALLISLTLILFVVLYFNFRNKKLLNSQLTQKKNQIEIINNNLQNSNEELRAKNEQLNETNQKLSSTLEMLKKTQTQLVQSEKMASLGVLTAGIAHEINNPINFVYTGINSLKKDFDDLVPILEEVKKLKEDNKLEYNDIIKKIIELKEENYFEDAYEAIPMTIGDINLGADRTADIVKGLRNFSRIDKQEWEEYDVHQGIDSTLLLLKNLYKNRIDIIKNYHKDLPSIQCYSGKINQVFMNILKNAIDAIPDKGNIEISTNFTKFGISISIKDSGTGIDNEILSKLFDPFFTTKKVGKGVGLGLSISYGIIKEHKGKINVVSEVGKGTEFIIKLPVSQIE